MFSMRTRKSFIFLLAIYNFLLSCSKQLWDSRNRSVLLNILRGKYKIRLPTVDILGIDSRWNFDCKGCTDRFTHVHDLLFYNYLMKHSVNETRKDAKRLYFLPAFPSQCVNTKWDQWNRIQEWIHSFSYQKYVGNTCYQEHWWSDLNKKLQELIEKSEGALDPAHIFMASTFPHHVPKEHVWADNERASFLSPKIGQGSYSHLLEISYLRVDSANAINMRQIIVPYVISRNAYKAGRNELRTHLFFVSTREAAGHNDENHLRTRAKYFLSKDGVVGGSSLKSTDFTGLARTSTFCAVVPGDTSSTSRLSKFVFTGCVPVIFCPSIFSLPFARFVNWPEFALIYPSSSLLVEKSMDRIYDNLLSLQNTTKLQDMQLQLKNAACFFDWRDDNEASCKYLPSPYELTLAELNLLHR